MDHDNIRVNLNPCLSPSESHGIAAAGGAGSCVATEKYVDTHPLESHASPSGHISRKAAFFHPPPKHATLSQLFSSGAEWEACNVSKFVLAETLAKRSKFVFIIHSLNWMIIFSSLNFVFLFYYFFFFLYDILFPRSFTFCNCYIWVTTVRLLMATKISRFFETHD